MRINYKLKFIADYLGLPALVFLIIFSYSSWLTLHADDEFIAVLDSVLFDLDTNRAIRELTSDYFLQRNILFHPLYKIFFAPLTSFFNYCINDGLIALRLVSSIAIFAYALLSGYLTSLLIERKTGWYIGSLATCSTFTAMLLSGVPDASSFSGLATVIPFVYYYSRYKCNWSQRELYIWALLFVLGLGITITQVAHIIILLMFRLWHCLPNGGTPIRKFFIISLLGIMMTGALMTFQAIVYPQTQYSLTLNDLEAEPQFLYGSEKNSTFTTRSTRVSVGILIIPFVAPQIQLSDYLWQQLQLKYYIVSFGKNAFPDWNSLQKIVLGIFIIMVLIPTLTMITTRHLKNTLPILISLMISWIIHFAYGHEMIMYSGNWVCLTVALYVLGCLSFKECLPKPISSLYLCIIILLTVACLASNWNTMRLAYLLAWRYNIGM